VRHKNRIETKTKQKNINTALSSFLFTGLYWFKFCFILYFCAIFTNTIIHLEIS
jgi:hypothetical protein